MMVARVASSLKTGTMIDSFFTGETIAEFGLLDHPLWWCYYRNLMKTAIIGPGAMGSMLAANLLKGGMDVTLMDYRPERAVALTLIGFDRPGISIAARDVVNVDGLGTHLMGNEHQECSSHDATHRSNPSSRESTKQAYHIRCQMASFAEDVSHLARILQTVRKSV